MSKPVSIFFNIKQSSALGCFRKSVRKVISFCLIILTAAASAGIPPALGADAYVGMPNPGNLLSAINFRDVSGHWARESIYRAASQGLLSGSQGYFKPNAPVTKEQAITTMVSLKGLDTEAQQAAADAAASGKKWRDLAEYWGNGYIEIALQQGMILPEEQQAFESGKRSPATREEVAAWCGRAIGLEPAYGAQQQRLLSLKDWRSVKPGYMGMVAAVINEGIMVGSAGGVFLPAKNVTRGEMAVISDKTSSRMAGERDLEFREGFILKKDEVWAGTNYGIVKEITYTVKDPSGQTFVLTAKDVPAKSSGTQLGFVVYKNRALGMHGLLRTGDAVKLILTNDGKIIFVQVAGSTPGSLTGTFAGLGSDNKTINIRDASGNTLVYPLKAAVTVTINNQSATVQDLIHGQEVALSLTGGSVAGIKGSTASTGAVSYSSPSRQVIEGQVSYVSSNGKELAVTANGGRVTLNLDSYTQITRSGSLIPASRIQVGDRVLAYLETGSISGNYVSRVEVSGSNNSTGNVFKGYVQAVYPVDNKVVLRDVKEYFFGGWYSYSDTLTLNVSSGAAIFLDGQPADLAWLAKAGLGLRLYAAVSDNGAGVRGLKLAAQSGPAEMYSSTVEEVDWAAGAIYLENGSGTFGPGTIALHNGKLIDAGDVQEDAHVFMETNLLGNSRLGTFIAWEDFCPEDFDISRGTLEEVDEEEFELDDYSEFHDNSWEDDGSSESLELSPEAYIIDARDRDNPVIVSVRDFRYSQYSGEFDDGSIVTVSRDDRVEGMIILSEDFGGDKTSVARIAAINGDRITLEREMDWSQATGQWKENSFPVVLDTGYALIYKNDERVGRGMLHVGDKVYIIHDMQGAEIIFIR